MATDRDETHVHKTIKAPEARYWKSAARRAPWIGDASRFLTL
jgi:hypothetical protein